MSGLYISGDISKDAIFPDKKAVFEYDRLREEATMKRTERFDRSNSNFTFCHLNTRPFNIHLDDIQNDHALTECDLLLFTETRLRSTSTHSQLQEFTIYHHNDDCDTFKSLAVCYRQSLSFEYIDSLPGMMVFSVCKGSFSSESLKFILLYRKNSLSNRDFGCMIEHLLSRHPDTSIITGDFNEDGFDMSQDVSMKLCNFEQLVLEPTQVNGRMLDQIYVSKYITFKKACLVKHIYFSDHDATICNFEVK